MFSKRTILAAATTALVAVPAGGIAAPVADKPVKPKPTQAKAYGKYCQDQSKKKAEGAEKSDFALCVAAMKQMAKQESKSDAEAKKAAKAACKPLSKKHVKGQKGTPYSRCIVAAAQLNKDEDDS